MKNANFPCPPANTCQEDIVALFFCEVMMQFENVLTFKHVFEASAVRPCAHGAPADKGSVCERAIFTGCSLWGF